MPFAYFQRLTRRQQGIYLRSEKITQVVLPGAAALRPLVAELGAALESGDRGLTESACQLLAGAMARALGLPPVRVTVLAARPHARWGELHGLYESTNRPGQPPQITLWMRTARQKRVVAFRTFLRTLLHEMGHHLDYTLLRLGDSLHTQGFYQRESHLFHQLVTDGGPGMATLEEQLARMERTVNDYAAAIKGVPDAKLSKRPDEKNWSAKEVVCHVRDTEESFMIRFQSVMAMDEPKFLPRRAGPLGHRAPVRAQRRAGGARRLQDAAGRDAQVPPRAQARAVGARRHPRHARENDRQGLRRAHGLARRQPPRPAQARPRRQAVSRG